MSKIPAVHRTEPVHKLERTDSEIMESLREANRSCVEKRIALVTMLQKVRTQFAFYADSHRQKGTEDGDKKAQTNEDFVKEIDEVLAQQSG
jgi:urocanate hydratase